ncbi:MAG: DUF928 domain-containing protein [Pyrinomonadaceae bacterium]|nr:DUF928 domain-containing protein [Pyrinomonadaceae bacterium]
MRNFSSSRRTSTIFLCLLTLCFNSFFVPAALRAQNQQPGPRRPLPKPPNGSRGFEQYRGRDASSRLVAVGATRGPLKPVAPYEGLAYGARPHFRWAPAVGANSYHFVLREGTTANAPVVYETDVTTSYLNYPASAPALAPGKLYSWRVEMAGVMERKRGQPATFYVLTPEDAKEIKNALEAAKLAHPQGAADRLRQAQIFEQYGVWYDALKIASVLVQQNSNDATAKSYYDALTAKLGSEQDAIRNSTKTAPNPPASTGAPTPTRTPAPNAAPPSASPASAPNATPRPPGGGALSDSVLRLWHEVDKHLAEGNEAAARAALSHDVNAARWLYKELFFDALDTRLYNNPPISPRAEQARLLIAQNVEEARALEAKLTLWSKEKKPDAGFTSADEGAAKVVYLYVAAKFKFEEKDTDASLTSPTSLRLIS